MTNSHNPELREAKTSKHPGKCLRRVVRLGLIAIALIGAACGDAVPPGGQAQALCSNACQWAYDGECDDGGEGRYSSECQYGSDCGDCGPRDPQEYNCCDDYRFFEDEMACMSGLKPCP